MSRYNTTLDRLSGAHRRHGEHTHGRRLLGMVVGFGLAMSVTATGAVALLNAIAYNDPGQAISSGKLSISLADNGAGFTQAISVLVPTDTVNRYVDVANNGTADGTDLTLTVRSATSNKLVNDATNGLQISIASCSGTWTPSTAATTCSGSVTRLVASTPLSGLMGTPQTVVSGAFVQGAVQHLRVTLILPAQSETTTNGVLPANSIQALTNTLTYTFALAQRVGTTTTT
jgi:spore coat-associated protein N